MSESEYTTPPLKTCTKCGHTFPATLEYFSREKAGKYGLRSRCKVCKAADDADYRAAHREELKAYRAEHREGERARTAAWRIDHRDEALAYQAAYRAGHREESAAYRAEHREETAASCAAYHAAHRDVRAAQHVAWHDDHPESRAVYERNRHARKLGNGGTHTPADIRAQYARQNGRCYWQATDECRDRRGKLDKYHVDHVMPVILGGSNGPENLVISCPTCNLSKGGMHPMDFCGRLL